MPHPADSNVFLAAHRALLRLGLALANSFAWIFIFHYFYILSGDAVAAFACTLLVYALAQGITLLFTPVSAHHLRHGTRRALLAGALFAALSYVVLGATLTGVFTPSSAVWGVVFFALLQGLYRALYWIPYRVFAAAPSPKNPLHALFEVLVALMPLFAALTLMADVPALRILFGASALILLSILPALFVPDAKERYSWGYAYTAAQLFRRKNSALVLNSFFEGMQGAALFLIWPIAIFFILGWSYAALGLVLTLTLLAVLALRRVVAAAFERLDIRASHRVQSVIAVSGWVARLAAGTPFGIIVADVYAYATVPHRGTLSDPFVQQQWSDRGAFIDEYTVLKEMARASGKIALCLAAGLLALSVPLVMALAAALCLAAFVSGIGAVLNKYASVS